MLRFSSFSSLRLVLASSGFVWPRRASEVMFPSSAPTEPEFQHCLPESLWERGYEFGSTRNSAGTYYRRILKDDRVGRAIFLAEERSCPMLCRPGMRPLRKTVSLTEPTWPPSEHRRNLTTL